MEERAELDLVDRGDDLRVLHELIEVRLGEVADPDRSTASVVEQRLHRAPRVEPTLGHRPVHEIEIDVRQPERFEAAIEGAQRLVVTLVGVPQLGGDEDLIARHTAVTDRDPDIDLVPVHRRRVDVPVAGQQRPLHRVLRRRPRPGAEHPEPHARDLDTPPEIDLRRQLHARDRSKSEERQRRSTKAERARGSNVMALRRGSIGARLRQG